MNGRRLRIALVAVFLATMAGAGVGAISQMTAVSKGDPRSGLLPPPPSSDPDPRPTPSRRPQNTAEPVATEETRGEVWLYTIAIGDSMSGLATRFGSTTEALLTLNPEYANSQDLVQVGSQMVMPCTPIAAAEDRC